MKKEFDLYYSRYYSSYFWNKGGFFLCNDFMQTYFPKITIGKNIILSVRTRNPKKKGWKKIKIVKKDIHPEISLSVFNPKTKKIDNIVLFFASTLNQIRELLKNQKTDNIILYINVQPK